MTEEYLNSLLRVFEFSLKCVEAFYWILALLAEREAQCGNETAAADLRPEARTTLETIPKGELRAPFMALPEMKKILSEE